MKAEEKVNNLLKEKITLKEENEIKDATLKVMEEEKQELKRQLKEEKEIIVKLENEEKAKSRVLHLVYEKLLGIEGRTGEGSEQPEVMGQIDQVIEQKVDELKLKLAQE